MKYLSQFRYSPQRASFSGAGSHIVTNHWIIFLSSKQAKYFMTTDQYCLYIFFILYTASRSWLPVSSGFIWCIQWGTRARKQLKWKRENNIAKQFIFKFMNISLIWHWAWIVTQKVLKKKVHFKFVKISCAEKYSALQIVMKPYQRAAKCVKVYLMKVNYR